MQNRVERTNKYQNVKTGELLIDERMNGRGSDRREKGMNGELNRRPQRIMSETEPSG